MSFYPALGAFLFWISLFVGIFLFTKYKKIYPVFYMISVALYIFTAGFTIDVYSFGKIGILSTLIISAILFMFLGSYFSKLVSPTATHPNA